MKGKFEVGQAQHVRAHVERKDKHFYFEVVFGDRVLCFNAPSQSEKDSLFTNLIVKVQFALFVFKLELAILTTLSNNNNNIIINIVVCCVNSELKKKWLSLIKSSSPSQSKLQEIKQFVDENQFDVNSMVLVEHHHKNESGYCSALHLACASGDVDVVRYLVESKHTNINQHDSNLATPLFYAVESSNWRAIVDYLIEHGDDVHAVDQSHEKCTVSMCNK